MLRDDYAAKSVGDTPACVADDVGITFLEAESSEDIYIDQYCFVSSKEVSDAFTNTSIHTDYNCNLAIYQEYSVIRAVGVDGMVRRESIHTEQVEVAMLPCQRLRHSLHSQLRILELLTF